MKRRLSGPALLVALLLIHAAPLFAVSALAQIEIASLTYLGDSVIQVDFSRRMFNRRTGEETTTVTVTNVSGAPIESTDGNLYLAMENITVATVTVPSADGTSVEGIPFYVFEVASLGPGAAVQRQVVFDNPQRARFNVDANAYVSAGATNHKPIADAGSNANGLVGSEIRLDGSGSYDPDGDLITYSWTQTDWPNGSNVELTGTDGPVPRLVPDVAGNYSFELIVTDDEQEASDPDTVTITASSVVAPPNADAGRDQQGQVGQVVTVDGTSSSDPQKLALTFAWTLVSKPPASTLTETAISGRDQPQASFMPDAEGQYDLQLEVDNGTATDVDTVVVNVLPPNLAPVADAGSDQASQPGQAVTLDGTASHDPDNGPQALSSTWTLVSLPPGSALTNADISGADTLQPTFTPDMAGDYILRHEVSDGEQSAGDNVLVEVEDNAPSIAITKPLDGGNVNTARPEISIQFGDNESGIDTSSFECLINGTDYSSAFNVGPANAVLQPTFDLPAGQNQVTASIEDRAGNEASAQSSFTVAFLRAIPGATPTAGYSPLTVRFTTDGEDPAGTIEIFRWDFDGNGSYDTYDTVARDYDHTYNTPGTFNATLYAWSSTGATAEASIPITVENNPPTASADVNPSNGPVPLTVTLAGTGSDSDGTIVRYEWDFEGDGIYDFSSTTTGITTHTYAAEGTFQAIFRVTDNSGNTATATATTTVVRIGPPGSPTATAGASPTSGNAPLTVNLTGSGSDPDGGIVLYEWDFDNDGSYDWSSASSGNTSHTYTQGGTHVATLRVTDNEGLTGIDQVLIRVNLQASLSVGTNTIGFLAESGSGMTATASSQYSASYGPAMAIDGNTGTFWETAPGDAATSWIEVTFDTLQRVEGLTVNWYSYSYRMTTARIDLYDGAGALLHTQTESFASNASSHQVDLPGVENVKRVRLSAQGTYSSYVMIRELTFDKSEMPGQGGPEPEPTGTTINTTISADTRVSIFIKNGQGNIERTLVDNEARTAGSHQDYWDAKDDGGVPVRDGLHYAVMEYRENGTAKTLDLTQITGGTRNSFPMGSSCNQRESFASPTVVKPFENDFMDLNFKLCTAQEVTMFIGPLNTQGDAARIRTIANRQIFPAGDSTLYWDGLDDNGNIAVAPSGDRLITGAWRYTLPNNAMYMTGGGPVIESISADPNYFSPFSEKCDSAGRSEGITLDYSLSKSAATVQLRVYSVESGELLRTASIQNVAAGANDAFWDGKNQAGEYVDIGDYQVGLIATDAQGNSSMLRYALVRVGY
ncbi:PDK repeat-containing protein [Thioflavicoccus mobilis 8321]|uniref:PDK repeat-containing protein n=1 Tax=Thioflavicoccus mobilis 8321 TaxID=765912 RepID=L0GX37_9GAMM|nr:PKD domain-containing protein [Thioflavicoccus mobilis]AGA90526.1 PDK repeat-containing protein [Thioflavicoccus mobilis 8321]